MTEDEFVSHVDRGGFLEWVKFLDYFQGTPEPELQPGSDAVFEIDVHGARQICERHPDALSIFIDTPSRAEQEARLRGRGEGDERIAQRLAKADEESAIADSIGSVRIINDVLDDTVEEILALIHSHRA